MKRILPLFTVLALAIGSVNAQITTPQTSSASQEAAIAKGNWMVGGSLGSTGYNFDTETFSINVNPSAAYFVKDNIALGAAVGLGLNAYDGGSSVNYSITPMIRYYFPEGATPTGRWFGEGVAGIGGSHTKNNDNDEPVSVVLGIAGGYNHFITRSVALEAKLGYTYSKADIDAKSGISGLGVSVGFQIFLPGRGNR